jgi:hypothetical protein
MVISIDSDLFQRLQIYLQQQSHTGDAIATELIQSLTQYQAPDKSFSQTLFATWQLLAEAQVGEKYWSYPVTLTDLATEMELSVEALAQQLEHLKHDDIELIQGRGHQGVTALMFHPAKAAKSKKVSKTQTFQVGDRVRVIGDRPHYANQTGVVEQVISVSCRVHLDNGWKAFLPHHCLERVEN